MQQDKENYHTTAHPLIRPCEVTGLQMSKHCNVLGPIVATES